MSEQFISVYNRSEKTFEVFISRYSNTNGSQAWVTLKPGEVDKRPRFYFELVVFREPGDDSTRSGVYVPQGTHVLFTDTGKVTTQTTAPPVVDPRPPKPSGGKIVVENKSGKTVEVFVSRYSNTNGSQAWVTLKHGETDTRPRYYYELVVFREPGVDAKREGVYVAHDSHIVFNGFGAIEIV